MGSLGWALLLDLVVFEGRKAILFSGIFQA